MYPPPVASHERSTADQRQTVLVEDRLAGGRSALPVPPSHRAPAPATATALLDRAPEPGRTPGPVPLLDQPQRPRKTNPEPAADVTLSWKQRAFRGVVLLGSIAAVALVVVLPDIRESTGQSALSTTATTTAAPIARAESLQNVGVTPVQISLERSSSLDTIELQAREARVGTPADVPGGFEAAVSEAVQDALATDQVSTTTTTVWEEPAIPPESEWVDSGNGVAVPDILLRIRFCESTNNYNAANAGSTARGAYQFLIGSWDWYGHAAITGITEAHLATPAQQDEAALRTLQDQGTGPWAESRPCWSDPGIDRRYATAKPPVVDPTDDQGTDTPTTTTTTTTTTTVPGDPETPDPESPDTTLDPDADAGDGAETTDPTVADNTAETTAPPEDSTPEPTTPPADSAGGQ